MYDDIEQSVASDEFGGAVVFASKTDDQGFESQPRYNASGMHTYFVLLFI
jgi:hypothetical protein